MRTVIMCGVLAGVVGLSAAAGCTTRHAGSPTTQRESSTSSTPPVEAADGTNLDACVDGNCEVALSGPATIPLGGQGGGVTALTVDEVTEDGIEFSATIASGSKSSGGLSTGCTNFFYQNGMSASCSSGGQQRPEPEAGVLAIQVVAVTDDEVVLALVAG